MDNNYNNDFLNYSGKISRKNYIINLLILVSMLILLSATDFSVFTKNCSELLSSSLFYILDFLKFVIIVAIISVVYRRIADFSSFGKEMKTFFVLFYFIPFLYISLGHFILDSAPTLISIFDWITLIIILPVAIISSFIFAFLKSKK